MKHLKKLLFPFMFLSFFLFTIFSSPINAQSSPPTNTSTLGRFGPKQTGYGFAEGSNLTTSIGNIVSNIIGFITIIAGIAFIWYFMIGAINWITAGGNPEKAQKARSTITQALIGLIIAVTAYPIAFVLTKLAGIPLTDPTQLLNILVFNNGS